MIFLLPVGGIIDKRFGILTSPSHKGIPAGIIGGMKWAAENEQFTSKFEQNPRRFFTWLDSMSLYRATCIFIPVPDKLGDSTMTMELWHKWSGKLVDWPRAFVCQDGQRPDEIPPECDTVFIGGNTAWKLSSDAFACIAWAQEHKKHVHIGRVNYWKRYAHFRALQGSERFTCDGTRTRFCGTNQTVIAWAEYMERQYQIHLPISIGYSCG